MVLLKKIPVGEHEAWVDPEDYPVVSGLSWHFHCGYARTTVAGRKVYMHRFILGLEAGEVCDHKNGSRMDNRRCNLRVVSKWENARNRVTGSGWIGVNASGSRYSASLIRKGKTIYVGAFDAAESAAYAVDYARFNLDGELLRPNLAAYVASMQEQQALDCFCRGYLRGVRNKNGSLARGLFKKILTSPLSNRYWARRLNLPMRTIGLLRSGQASK